MPPVEVMSKTIGPGSLEPGLGVLKYFSNVPNDGPLEGSFLRSDSPVQMEPAGKLIEIGPTPEARLKANPGWLVPFPEPTKDLAPSTRLTDNWISSLLICVTPTLKQQVPSVESEKVMGDAFAAVAHTSKPTKQTEAIFLYTMVSSCACLSSSKQVAKSREIIREPEDAS